MAKWISIEKAAIKYGINKEVIWLWAKTKRFSVSYAELVPTVDEESIRKFLYENQEIFISEYVDTLEELCIQKNRICDMYVEIIGAQEKELLQQREIVEKIGKIQEAVKMQTIRVRDCEKVFAEYDKSFGTGWIKRMWNRLKP